MASSSTLAIPGTQSMASAPVVRGRDKLDPRFLAMAGGIVCAALAFSVAATCMGLYQAGQFEGAEVAFSQKSLGIAVVPLFFGSILFALNAFLLGLARFLRR